MKSWLVKASAAGVISLGLALTLTGCGGNSQQQQSAAGQTLTVELFDNNNAPNGQGTTQDNKWTQYIQGRVKSELGFDIQFVLCPRDQAPV